MKKFLAAALSTAMLVGLCACGSDSSSNTGSGDASATPSTTNTETSSSSSSEGSSADIDYGSGEIKVWVADAVVGFTEDQIKNFQDAHPEFSGYTFLVEAVGEGDAAGNMITDVTAGADIYGFAQDQLARLVAAGALIDVDPTNAEILKAQNSGGVVSAATVGDTLYAYPMTADNGYFLYYDKSVITDPSTLEGIVEQCEAAGKNFYMDLTGWYQVAFFFGTGCDITYDYDNDSNVTGCNISGYTEDAGLVALKEMIELASSSSFQHGSSAGDAVNYAAIIDGTWDAATIQEVLGDNYACAKLPTFTGSDGKTYQMSGFNGCKLLGVKPQTDEGKLAVCDALALYLTSEEVQLARFNAVGWGPSNLNAQASPEVQADEALAALSAQFNFTQPQGNYPGDYWTTAEALSGSVRDELQGADDDALKAALENFAATCKEAK